MPNKVVTAGQLHSTQQVGESVQLYVRNLARSSNISDGDYPERVAEKDELSCDLFYKSRPGWL